MTCTKKYIFKVKRTTFWLIARTTVAPLVGGIVAVAGQHWPPR